MIVLFSSLLIILFCTTLWFKIPYSPLKHEFEKKYQQALQNQDSQKMYFSDALLSGKPELLQKYIKYCGLYHKPMMNYSMTVHDKADFLLQEHSPMVKIKYTQINFAYVCQRLAFIDTALARIIPMQGLDEYMDGNGGMKGVIAKVFTLFNVQGKEMDIACLVTVLAESVVCPSFLMNDAIDWKEMDHTHLHAVLTQNGISVSGIFEFDCEGAIISFYTKDRYQENNGQMILKDWKAVCGAYKETGGIKHPSFLRASWISDDSEQVYFDCNSMAITFHY